ncbi:MAG: hypothetical protein H7Z72_05925 [Bacteroidetes bacterium]|nr:hypothetical protein [Fibrella sp.]
MNLEHSPPLTRAQESRVAIERLYVTMRHLFNRGFYKPSGVSGEEVRTALLTLRPEIYGSVTDPQRVELDGLVYVMDRLPKGIESCQIVMLASREGFEHSHFPVLVPAKRRRNCYRVDQEQMVIEVTNGRSEIYDILTHLTFMFMEADKIRRNVFLDRGGKTREWEKLEAIVKSGGTVQDEERELALTYLSSILGRTFEETQRAYQRFTETAGTNSGLFQIVYGLGTLSVREIRQEHADREVNFTPMLRERIGQHLYGERWATRIKQYIWANNLQNRPIHVISANPHSVANCLYAPAALADATTWDNLYELALKLSQSSQKGLRQLVNDYALAHGLHELEDAGGTNLRVQLIDTARLDVDTLSPEISHDPEYIKATQPLLLVMDYAFGEQAFETMDELLKPYELTDEASVTHTHPLNVASISIMGKAGILTGDKGDLMIPTSHIFEGTADNYPLENDFTPADFADNGLGVYQGAMITVLGTSLQNKDVLAYFKNSSWQAIGLEMEGAHYQKAIQAQSKIRGSIPANVKVRYAYYASDNPLLTGATLASGSLGTLGVKPTYLITIKCLEKILRD